MPRWNRGDQERLMADLGRERADPVKKVTAWLDEPDQHDYAAAEHYLSLISDPDTARKTAEALKQGSIEHRQAKDILRAAQLPLLDQLDALVAKDLRKVGDGKELSPVLLVRGDAASGLPLEVADGYHRICASYHVDENTDIPCRLTDWDWGVVGEVDYDEMFEAPRKETHEAQ